jgi:hypothetical protein
MRKLLMATAALLVLSNAPVFAGSAVPRDMLGTYCTTDASNAVEKDLLLLEDKREDCGDRILVIRANHYTGSEHICQFTAVKSVFDRDIIATTKTMGVTRWQIEATCTMAHNSEREGCTWKERFSLYRTQGYPMFRPERRSQDRCQ